MLDSMRRGIKGWGVKVLMALLIASFALVGWGVQGDVAGGFMELFGGMNPYSVARVGGQNISVSEYQRAYHEQIVGLSNRFGQQITTEMARELQIPQRTISQLITSAVLDQEARALGLGVPDKVIADELAGVFKDKDGKFSPALYQRYLKENQISEAAFVARERENLIRQQIVGAAGGEAVVPKVLAEAVNRFQNEKRTARYFTVPASAAGEIPAPSDAELTAYYEANKGAYMVPEYRKTELVLLPVDSLYEKVTVTDADVKAAYEARKDKLGKPEKRHIQQIAFPDLATAKEAAAKLKAGADFVAVAKEYGFKDSEIDMGTAAKTDMTDRKLADAAFSLKQGEVSGVIEGQLAPTILRAIAIEPGERVPFEDAKERLRQDLIAEREKPLKTAAQSKLNTTINNIEDERAQRTPFRDIAKRFSLKYVEMTVSKEGLSPDGTRPADLPASKDLLASIFKTDPGVEASAADLDAGGVAFFNVADAVPPRQKTLDEVKEQVTAGWREGQIKKRMDAKAAEIVKSAKAGEKLETLAKPFKAEVRASQPLKRDGSEAGLPASAVARLFTMEKGGYASAAAAQNGRVIFTLTEIVPADPLTPEQIAAARKELGKMMASDYLAQYLTGLRDVYGVKTNPKTLARLLGQESESEN